jgi:hypothetical protein
MRSWLRNVYVPNRRYVARPSSSARPARPAIVRGLLVALGLVALLTALHYVEAVQAAQAFLLAFVGQNFHLLVVVAAAYLVVRLLVKTLLHDRGEGN